MSLEKAPTLFKCVTCGKEYTKRSSFQSHMEMHSEKLHACKQCDMKWKSRAALRNHKMIAHGEAGPFECDECGKLCPHSKALKDHKRWAHHGREFECPVCSKKMNPWLSSRHMETHAGQQCKCDVCGTIRRTRTALAEHKRSAHSETKHRCELCGKVFGLAKYLRQHAVIHDEERDEYPCGRCPRTFKTSKGRGDHTRFAHSDSSFTCDPECDLHSATRSEYMEHLNRWHAKQHPATCKYASVDVKRARNVGLHLGNTAFLEATMQCTHGGCDFATTCARGMETHKEQCHHDAYKPVLRCSSCQTWFASKRNMKRHKVVKHRGERRYKCGDCGYINTNKENFIAHLTSCQQATAMGNHRLKLAEPTTENTDVKKESPYAIDDSREQASTSSRMASLFSAAPASTCHAQLAANTAACSLFSAPDDRRQQASTSSGMSSVRSTASSRPR